MSYVFRGCGCEKHKIWSENNGLLIGEFLLGAPAVFLWLTLTRTIAVIIKMLEMPESLMPSVSAWDLAMIPNNTLLLWLRIVFCTLCAVWVCVFGCLPVCTVQHKQGVEQRQRWWPEEVVHSALVCQHLRCKYPLKWCTMVGRYVCVHELRNWFIFARTIPLIGRDCEMCHAI